MGGMRKLMMLAFTLSLATAQAQGQDCTRFYDLTKKTVVENCTPTKPPATIAPGAKALSVTAPELNFPPGIMTAVVEKVIDPITFQLRFDYQSHTVTLSDLRLPERTAPEYRAAMSVARTLAPASSVLYLERKDGAGAGRKPLYSLWQLNNLIAVILVEQGLAEYVPNVDNDYDDILTRASEFAHAQKLGMWSR